MARIIGIRQVTAFPANVDLTDEEKEATHFSVYRSPRNAQLTVSQVNIATGTLLTDHFMANSVDLGPIARAGLSAAPGGPLEADRIMIVASGGPPSMGVVVFERSA